MSHSFFLSYGTILPTSLTYIIRIGHSLLNLKTCCGYLYGADWKHAWPAHFQGRHVRSQGLDIRVPSYTMVLRVSLHDASSTPIVSAQFDPRWLSILNRKENSTRPDKSRLCIGLSHLCLKTPIPRKGILTLFPFGELEDTEVSSCFSVVNLPLRTDSLTSKFNWWETIFHTSAETNLMSLIATTTKIFTSIGSRESHDFSFNSNTTPAYKQETYFFSCYRV